MKNSSCVFGNNQEIIQEILRIYLLDAAGSFLDSAVLLRYNEHQR